MRKTLLEVGISWDSHIFQTALLRSDTGTPRMLICGAAEGSAQLEEDSLAGVKYMDVSWGRENGGATEGGSCFYRETKGREREWS